MYKISSYTLNICRIFVILLTSNSLWNELRNTTLQILNEKKKALNDILLKLKICVEYVMHILRWVVW